ncbi:hypothetical protein GALL_36660 [mine drainage metagenome]|uniref:Uncharacterized protein n=1 Tax=mine drainage metagenome TaxID=410659 RepID=A0A1J5TGN1_9ZZZZ
MCASCKAGEITDSTGREHLLLGNWNSICRTLPASPIKRSTDDARKAICSNAPRRFVCLERLAEKPSPNCPLFFDEQSEGVNNVALVHAER